MDERICALFGVVREPPPTESPMSVISFVSSRPNLGVHITLPVSLLRNENDKGLQEDIRHEGNDFPKDVESNEQPSASIKDLRGIRKKIHKQLLNALLLNGGGHERSHFGPRSHYQK